MKDIYNDYYRNKIREAYRNLERAKEALQIVWNAHENSDWLNDVILDCEDAQSQLEKNVPEVLD